MASSSSSSSSNHDAATSTCRVWWKSNDPMVQLVANIHVSVLVHKDTVTISECSAGSDGANRARDASERGSIGSIFGPPLHSIVVRVKNVDRRVGNEDVRGLIELVGASSRACAKDGGGRRRVRLDDDDPVVTLISDVESIVIRDLYAMIGIQRREPGSSSSRCRSGHSDCKLCPSGCG